MAAPAACWVATSVACGVGPVHVVSVGWFTEVFSSICFYSNCLTFFLHCACYPQ